MFTQLQDVYCFSKINLKRNLSIGGEDFLPHPPQDADPTNATSKWHSNTRPMSGTRTHCDILQLHGASISRQCHTTVT